jgi:hypothetical protein
MAPVLSSLELIAMYFHRLERKNTPRSGLDLKGLPMAATKQY